MTFSTFVCRDVLPRLGAVSRNTRQKSLQKLIHLQQSIANWEGQDLSANSTEIVCGKDKYTERSLHASMSL